MWFGTQSSYPVRGTAPNIFPSPPDCLRIPTEVHDGRRVTVHTWLHHKSPAFTGEKADEVLSHGWHVNYSPPPTPPSHLRPFGMWATCHKRRQPTAISDISRSEPERAFSSVLQTHDWCAVHLSSSPGGGGQDYTLDLNNSSHLFEIGKPL